MCRLQSNLSIQDSVTLALRLLLVLRGVETVKDACSGGGGTCMCRHEATLAAAITAPKISGYRVGVPRVSDWLTVVIRLAAQAAVVIVSPCSEF